MIRMKPKDTIKQKNLESIKTERYPTEEVYRKMICIDIYMN